VIVAAGLRFWQLGEAPPGFYRDEAANGLDALDVLSGDRQGQSPIYFSANNGREPAYIYLTAISVALLGNTTLAVRLTAAVVGTLTTWFLYKLAESWFGKHVGLLSAVIWAITVWPIHLSRIGLRPILLPLMLSLVFWLGTLAYRRSRDGRNGTWLWLLSGLIYGLSFYTYLAIRFTPVILVLLVIYLYLTGRKKALWPGAAVFVAGAAVALVPLMLLALDQPDLLLGRLGQVSILNPAINDGDLPGALWRQIWATLGLFFVAGDDIIRHNPPDRPLFDLLVAVPFLAGVVWCAINWRRPAAMTLLLWVGIMLAPTILAEDAPHFLRAVGILPGALIFPAIGLWLLWSWSRVPGRLAQALVIGVLLASLALTINDYFGVYSRQPQTAYWFEEAAGDLAKEINDEAAGTTTYVDRRFWQGWPAVRFLVDHDRLVNLYEPGDLSAAEVMPPAAIYAWPYERLDQSAQALAGPALVSGATGSLVQGDLEPEAYPLYVRYGASEATKASDESSLAIFDNAIQLSGAEISPLDGGRLQVDLRWSLIAEEVDRSLVAFVHVMGPDGLIGQSDSVPGDGNWPAQWWRKGLTILDPHMLTLEAPYEEEKHQILIGLYEAATQEHLSVLNKDGAPVGDAWLWQP
jgi:4-amino-4-deoxy-L-arabinose transferase-like glycosyltransferase